MSALANFLRMLDAGKDGALLRYSLGNEYAKAGDAANAALHLRRAVGAGPGIHGRMETAGPHAGRAGQASRSAGSLHWGIAVAGRRGDKQAQKEMQVFARRSTRA